MAKRSTRTSQAASPLKSPTQRRLSTRMMIGLLIGTTICMIAPSCQAFTPSLPGFACSSRRVLVSTGAEATAETETRMADSGVPPSTTGEGSSANTPEGIDIPTVLPSDKGIDYVPLATMLASGQLAEADQFTRDALIELSGAKAKGRNFVYFTDVKNIPSKDLATIERLWNKFSRGKFGYSVQKKKWRQTKGDFEAFCRKVGWTTTDGEVERKKRWFGASEFIYDVKKAPEGHLPLTSALRGTSLLKNLLNHPVWDNDDWMQEP